MLACFDLYQLPVNVLWFSDRIKAVSLMIDLDLLFLHYVNCGKDCYMRRSSLLFR